MKKRNSLVVSIAILLITLSNLFVFADKIASKPTEAGYWMLIVFGVALGVTITNLKIFYSKNK